MLNNCLGRQLFELTLTNKGRGHSSWGEGLNTLPPCHSSYLQKRFKMKFYIYLFEISLLWKVTRQQCTCYLNRSFCKDNYITTWRKRSYFKQLSVVYDIHNIILVFFPIIYGCPLPLNNSVIKLDFVPGGRNHKIIYTLLLLVRVPSGFPGISSRFTIALV